MDIKTLNELENASIAAQERYEQASEDERDEAYAAFREALSAFLVADDPSTAESLLELTFG